MAKAADHVPMTTSGHCEFPSKGSHSYCHELSLKCTCKCHADEALRMKMDGEYTEKIRAYSIDSLK